MRNRLLKLKPLLGGQATAQKRTSQATTDVRSFLLEISEKLCPRAVGPLYGRLPFEEHVSASNALYRLS